MLGVEEVNVLLNFLEVVPVTGRTNAKNLSIICAKLEAYRDRVVEAELAARFAPPPSAGEDKDLEESTKDQINKDLY